MKIPSDKFEQYPLNKTQREYIYNAFDAACTGEIFEILYPQLDPETTERVYSFQMALQAVALSMGFRGTLVDRKTCSHMISILEKRTEKYNHWLQKLAFVIWEKELNINSPKQLADFLYSRMRCAPVYKWDPKSKTKKLSTDRDALEKSANYLYARPIINLILALRDTKKQLDVLKTGIDSDNRMRFTFKVSTTVTGRFASGKNPIGGGWNAQNITEELRRIFVAPRKKKLAYVDYEQAESRVVAYLANDLEYIKACETSDPHTYVTKLIWPNKPWTGNLKKDKEIAEEIFYRHLTFRFMSKKAGHGTNYYGKSHAISTQMQIHKKVIEEFQARYLETFSGIRKWHKHVIATIERYGEITTPTGRRRQIWSRRDQPKTHREIIAHGPQSLVADILNRAMLIVWKELEPLGINLLKQVHDAILFEYPEDQEEFLLPLVKTAMEFPVNVGGNLMTIPSEIMVGWNWMHQDPNLNFSEDGNPDGLKLWTPETPDNRTRQHLPSQDVLDIIL